MNPDKLNEYRIFHLSAQTFLPLVDEMHTTAYDNLMLRYRAGDKDLLASVAKCEALFTLKEEIVTKAKLYEHSAKK